ncbi:hypothetical protein PsorP6_001096 [Peronosclerospora sorghi]|uniref:Uncharacterized protein n=1 Tax=Peronosclerospora sorghi TaxID=230839 RepID=A0ACC0WZR6_9STRA|nr:hypothetical protein PsorP6_001096 [Peronosclerospora sorghi]
MKPLVRRSLQPELHAAANTGRVKPESTNTQYTTKIDLMRTEVLQLRHQADATANMEAEMIKLPADLARIMSTQPQLQTELADLRDKANTTPQLFAEIEHRKAPPRPMVQILDYLKYVAHLMTGNHYLLLLENFCESAYPDLASTLIARIDQSNTEFYRRLTVYSPS